MSFDSFSPWLVKSAYPKVIVELKESTLKLNEFFNSSIVIYMLFESIKIVF